MLVNKWLPERREYFLIPPLQGGRHVYRCASVRTHCLFRAGIFLKNLGGTMYLFDFVVFVLDFISN